MHTLTPPAGYAPALMRVALTEHSVPDLIVGLAEGRFALAGAVLREPWGVSEALADPDDAADFLGTDPAVLRRIGEYAAVVGLFWLRVLTLG
jgi:hypothetical protein